MRGSQKASTEWEDTREIPYKRQHDLLQLSNLDEILQNNEVDSLRVSKVKSFFRSKSKTRRPVSGDDKRRKKGGMEREIYRQAVHKLSQSYRELIPL